MLADIKSGDHWYSLILGGSSTRSDHDQNITKTKWGSLVRLKGGLSKVSENVWTETLENKHCINTPNHLNSY